MIQDRDMKGYGATSIDPKWPNKAKLAVQFVINYEEGGENCILNGDKASEAFLSEIVNAQPIIGMRNMNMESLYEYGSRAGFWRLLRIFTQHQLPATVFAVTTALQKNHDVIEAMQKANWEIACHGLKWVDYQFMDKATEREHITQALNGHRKLTGVFPQGWYTGRISPNTRSLVLEQTDLAYDSDSYADDLPYWCYDYDKPHLIIPYTLDTNDMRFCTSQGFNCGDQFFFYLKDAFDQLYSEALANPKAAKLLNIGLHCRITGRPARTASLARFINYINQYQDIWVTRRIDIAEHWKKHHPPMLLKA
ncbi:allantoinase PuuE [Parashewanella spongiae]|uniref:Allantoinase PuuE n=1 Tax=Parashewanella spongiae TaxID=342950 RepID=A0A3A6U306_9GAMM|nr:allantoinase PuuE [Parashewanella spongiae]MCL1077461.1 allantoinase PuuE [Parashewanella spongiae]RJY18400.1 allantoinase PuuE [Parashewanella spongiae]